MPNLTRLGLRLRRKATTARDRCARIVLESLEGRVTPASYLVTNRLDNLDAGSLRWAITQANQNPGMDTISIDPALRGNEFQVINGIPTIIVHPAATIAQGGSLPLFTDNLNVTGNDRLTISGQNAHGICTV